MIENNTKILVSGKIFLLKKDVKTFRSRPLILKEVLFFSNLHPLGPRQNKLMKSNTSSKK